jgi:3-deoxy-D-manno-octulosonate 8-phosphate phosphatase (KDO 8-P phosphatase)
MGVERLRAQGIETALLTREPSPIVARRAEKLRIRLVYLGVPDKRLFLPRILDDAAVALDQLAYIGDDVNDAGVMETIAARGLLGAPADARPEIRRLAHHRGTVAGGHGAFREFAEWLLELRAAANLSAAVGGGGADSLAGLALPGAGSDRRRKEGDA